METGERFDEAYAAWIAKHLSESSGDRRLQLERRLKEEAEGDESAEKLFLRQVWWPVYGNLHVLIPELEVTDGLGKLRSLDHAIVQYPKLVDLEVDGYGPHQKNASRWTFADDRRRDAGLHMIGWDVLRFAYSDVKQYPLSCQQLLKSWMARYEPVPKEEAWTRHVVRLGTYHQEFTLDDAIRVLGVSDKPARDFLLRLVERGVVECCGVGRKRIRAFRLTALGEKFARDMRQEFYFRT